MEEQFYTLLEAIELEDIRLFKDKWSLEIANSWHGPDQGYCLIHEAITWGLVEFVRFMLENGANPNVHTRRWKDTPLMFGLSINPIGRMKMCLLLLKYGGDPYKKNINGDNSFRRENTTDYMESFLVVELVCGEADHLSLDIWRVVKPFIY